jgi:hypothetical protein
MGFVIPDRVSAGNVLDVAVNVGEQDELVLDVQKTAVHHLSNMGSRVMEEREHIMDQIITSFYPVQELGCTSLKKISNYMQHCFICRPSTVPKDAGIEPRNVAPGALAVSRSYH